MSLHCDAAFPVPGCRTTNVDRCLGFDSFYIENSGKVNETGPKLTNPIVYHGLKYVLEVQI